MMNWGRKEGRDRSLSSRAVFQKRVSQMRLTNRLRERQFQSLRHRRRSAAPVFSSRRVGLPFPSFPPGGIGFSFPESILFSMPTDPTQPTGDALQQRVSLYIRGGSPSSSSLSLSSPRLHANLIDIECPLPPGPLPPLTALLLLPKPDLAKR